MQTDQILLLDAATTQARLPFRELVDTLGERLCDDFEAPQRHQHVVTASSRQDGVMLLMPGWTRRGAKHPMLGLKIVNVFPGNNEIGLAALTSSYLLYDGETGLPRAIIDGNTLTNRRTAATAALAARHLARADASDLLVLGSGRVASLVFEAMKAVRPITKVRIWDINAEGAERLAATIRDEHAVAASVVSDLDAALSEADIVSAATLAGDPIIKGARLKPGAHVDLIGSFTPAMREADDEAIRRARVYIDTPVALRESGDLTQPLESGALARDGIQGTLEDLVSGRVDGRRSDGEITLFKAVGSARTDLVAAGMIYDQYRG